MNAIEEEASLIIYVTITMMITRYSITKVERDMFNPCNSSKGNALVKIVLIVIKDSVFPLARC